MLSVQFLPDEIRLTPSEAMTPEEVSLARQWVEWWAANKPNAECLPVNLTYVMDYRPMRTCCVLKLVINDSTGDYLDMVAEATRIGFPID